MKIKRAELLHIIAESIENAFHLPSYAEWKRNIEEEVMWYLYNGGKSRWKIGGNVFFDNSGHALYHLGPTLLCEVLKHVNLNMADEKGMIEQVVELGRPIGYQECVETNDSDNIVYLQRNGRKRQSRYAVGRSPDPCSTVFIVLRKIKKTQNVYQIITGYVGTKSGKEPWDRRATDSDAEFWRNHALVSPDEIDSSEDVGEEGYWTRIVAESIKNYFYKNMKKNIVKLNEAQLRKMIAENVKKVIKEYVEGEQGGTDVYKWVPDTYVDYYLKANKYGDYSVLAGNKINSIYPGKIIAVPTPEEAQLLSKKYGPCILKITASTEGVSQGRNCVLVEPDSVLNIERIA